MADVASALTELNLAQAALEEMGFGGNEELVSDTLSERDAVEELLSTLGDDGTDMLGDDGMVSTLDASSLAAVDVIRKQLSWNRRRTQRRTKRRTAEETDASRAAKWLDSQVRKLVRTMQRLGARRSTIGAGIPTSSEVRAASRPVSITLDDLKTATGEFENLSGTLKTAEEKGYIVASQALDEDLGATTGSVVITLLAEEVQASDANTYTLRQLRRSTRRHKGRGRTSSDLSGLQLPGDAPRCNEALQAGHEFSRGRSNVVSMRRRPATLRRKKSAPVVDDGDGDGDGDGGGAGDGDGDGDGDGAGVATAAAPAVPAVPAAEAKEEKEEEEEEEDEMDSGTMVRHDVGGAQAGEAVAMPFMEMDFDTVLKTGSGVVSACIDTESTDYSAFSLSELQMFLKVMEITLGKQKAMVEEFYESLEQQVCDEIASQGGSTDSAFDPLQDGASAEAQRYRSRVVAWSRKKAPAASTPIHDGTLKPGAAQRRATLSLSPEADAATDA